MESKSAAIYSYLEKKIIRGEYKPGDRLPSESELCSRFEVSRGPVRAALDQLMALRLVFKKKGGGSYVSEQNSTDFINTVLPALRFNTNDYSEILQIRLALDRISIELYLQNRARENHDELESILKAMEKAHSAEALFDLDRAFHTTISSLSGNQLLHSFNLIIWDLLRNCPKDEYYPGVKSEWVEEHRQIFDGLKDNDPEIAVVFAARHLKKLINQDKKHQDPATDSHRWNPWLYDTL